MYILSCPSSVTNQGTIAVTVTLLSRDMPIWQREPHQPVDMDVSIHTRVSGQSLDPPARH